MTPAEVAMILRDAVRPVFEAGIYSGHTTTGALANQFLIKLDGDLFRVSVVPAKETK